MSLVGKPAPDFTLDGYFNGDFVKLHLGDLRGKWVYVLFYPLDFTFVCPTEVLKFSELEPEFASRDCRVVGISVDSKFTHKAWVDGTAETGGLGGKLAYPLLADLSKKVSRDYGVLHDDAVALRGLFLVNPQGTVVHETTNFLPVGRSAREALRTLKAFRFVAEHGDQVCPAEWDENGETMTATTAGMRAFLAKR